MKKNSLLLVVLLTISLSAQNNMKNSLHQFTVETLEGKTFDFSSLKGKKIMVVNTASKCGLTPQYKDLQALYEQYGQDKFVIVGFPANDFLAQEPGTNEEIGDFWFPIRILLVTISPRTIPQVWKPYSCITKSENNGFDRLL